MKFKATEDGLYQLTVPQYYLDAVAENNKKNRCGNSHLMAGVDNANDDNNDDNENNDNEN